MIFIIAVIILVDSVYHSTIILSYDSGGKEEGEGSTALRTSLAQGVTNNRDDNGKRSYGRRWRKKNDNNNDETRTISQS